MTTTTIEWDVAVPSGDGVVLAADVYRPTTGRVPAVLVRTPYGRRTPASTALQVHAAAMARAGYAVVVQDVRGRGGSGGAFEPFISEGYDGLATVDWMTDQAWSDGNLGTAGSSYLGFAQLALAAAAPPALRAWVPALTVLDVRRDWIRPGGMLDLGFHLSWALGNLIPGDPRTADGAAASGAFADPLATARRGVDAVDGEPAAGFVARWAARPDPYSGDPRVPGPDDLAGVTVPALVVAGWHDVFSAGSFRLWEALQAEAPDAGHRLLVGPWDHGGLPLGRRSGDADHGPAAAVDLHEVQRRWFDVHLRGEGTAPPRPVRVFLTGVNRWANLAEWPPPATRMVLYGHADGTLRPREPAPGPSLSLTVDPADPTPAPGGRLFPWEPALRPGVFDQRFREARADVAVFTTGALSREVWALGPVRAGFAAGDGGAGLPLVVTLCDVDPSGASWNVADGVAAVTAEGPVVVDLGHAGHCFRPGHRIRLDVSGAAHPRFPVPAAPASLTLDLGPGGAWLDLASAQA